VKTYYVYILKCSDNSFYTGVTSNLEQRLIRHNEGFYKNSYTSTRRPVQLVFKAGFSNINMAIKKEKQIKKWSKVKKETLINGDYHLLPSLSKKKF